MERGNKHPDFVHLHVHSHYSLLDGLTKVPDLVAKVGEQGAEALALTDHGNMYGAIEFYEECLKNKIKPIIGSEIYITQGNLEDREATTKREKNYHHLVLLAKNFEGYQNLMRITTKAHLEGYYYRPRIDHEYLANHAKGLICLSGCLRGELPSAILQGDKEKARRIISWHKELFGADYYLELERHLHIPEQKTVNEALIKLGKEFNIPLVATVDSHYLSVSDAEAQDVLLCIQTNATLQDENRFTMKGEIFDLTDPQLIKEHFRGIPETLTNTKLIADKVELTIPMGKPVLPHFGVPKGESEISYLKKLVEKGARQRLGSHLGEEEREKLKYELSIIEKTGYEAYFLVVADFVNWAKSKGIVVGPGRGSAASSLVSYVLGITDVNPLRHGLFFERFLNLERIQMPDFDIDFADDRRGEVIQYMVEKYGKEKVAQIITFGTMASRAAVRDVGRVLGMSYSEVDRIAKMIPPPVQGRHIPLGKTLGENKELTELYRGDPRVKKLLDLAKKLEGTVRHASTHAAGVVLGDKDLVNYAPLQYTPKGEISLVTQYSMIPLEKLGLLKMDFLGLKNLTTIKNTLRIVRKTQEVNLDISQIPFDDKKTYQLLAATKTTGVFQLEGEGMRRYLGELKPGVFEDIVAMVALYRPGPIELIPDFIARKHGKKKIEYLHPKLEPILRETYGIAVYQEQVLQVARDLCGFTLGEADVLRKAIGKKIPRLLIEQREKFISGAIKNGVSPAVAEQLFEFVKPFAAYGFNKAHAVGYATISYWTAYLKANFPREFMAALLTSDANDLDKTAKNIAEAKNLGIKVMPPDVNESFTDFAVVKDSGNIRFGLNAIKNVGYKVSEMIVEERKENGWYGTLDDFLGRVPRDVLNRKTLESLIKAGALDNFGERNALLTSLPELSKFAEETRGYRDRGQTDLFGVLDPEILSAQRDFTLPAVAPASREEKLAWEKELLGTYVSEHPLEEVLPKLRDRVREIVSLKLKDDRSQVRLAGLLTRLQRVTTKNGEGMLFADLEDLSGTVELIVFPKVLSSEPNLWQKGTPLIIEGRVNVKDVEVEGDHRMEVKVVVEKMKRLDQNMVKKLLAQKKVSKTTPAPNHLIVHLPKGFGRGKLLKLKEVLGRYPGETPVVLEMDDAGGGRRLAVPLKVDHSANLQKELKDLFEKSVA